MERTTASYYYFLCCLLLSAQVIGGRIRDSRLFMHPFTSSPSIVSKKKSALFPHRFVLLHLFIHSFIQRFLLFIFAQVNYKILKYI